MLGTSQCSTYPTASTLATTSPTESDSMSPRLCHRRRGSTSRVSLNSSGAMNSTRKSSDSTRTSRTPGTSTDAARPKITCSTGSETFSTTWSRTEDSPTHASTTNMNSNCSKGPPTRFVGMPEEGRTAALPLRKLYTRRAGAHARGAGGYVY